MNNVLFENFGIEIIERQGALYIRYDVGELVVLTREDEITEAEANKAKRSESDAYEVLLAIQRRLTASGIDPYVSNLKTS